MTTEILFQQALAYNGTGDWREAVALYRQVLAVQPDHFDAAHLLGVVLLQNGSVDDGLVWLRKAVAINPGNADAHYNLGVALTAVGRDVDAVASYGRAVALKPALVEAWRCRAASLRRLRSFSAALLDCDQALKLRPGAAETWAERGYALAGLGRLAEAFENHSAALRAQPDLFAAWRGRGDALAGMERFEDALRDYDRALMLKAGDVDALINRGNSLRELGRVAAAVASYAQAIEADPDNADARFNQALCLLLMGNMAQGWPLYEWRKKRAEPIAARDYAQPLWTGSADIADKILFIYREQGLGDTIQFCRYLPLLRARGARVIVAAPRSLHALLRSLNPAPDLIDEQETPPAFDLHCPLLSLPLAFATVVETVPAFPRYLHADAGRVKTWRARLGGAGFKIGVCWQGNDNAQLQGRSFALDALRDVAAIPGVRLISLQKDVDAAPKAALPLAMKIEDLGADFDADGQAFQDAAAVIEVVDLVITLDSAIAHLAGALGRPVWVALKAVPDWRWLLEGDTSPWYPSMRLFRQRDRGDWRRVFSDMAQEINRMIDVKTTPGAPPTPMIPAAWGEVIDKITILEIKRARIPSAAAVAHIEKELALLARIADDVVAAHADIARLKQELAAVNQALWEVEDGLRDKEKAGDFGDEFIDLARAVYRFNDRRAAIKKAINVALASEIVEEKSYGQG